MPFTGVALMGQSVEEHIRTAVEAEKAGYLSAWMPEVFGPDAITVLAAAAIHTSRITLATGIVSTYVRSPYLAAMSFHSLQELTGPERLIAGFGTSTPVIVEGWHGLKFENPIGTTREFVDLFRRLVAGERVKADGVYKIRGVALQRPAKGPIPVYLGALNDGMLRLAARIGDGIILNFPTLSYAKHALEVISGALEAAGRKREDVRIVANFRSGTGDFAELAAVLRGELITYLLAPVYQKCFEADGWGAEVDRTRAAWAAGDRAGAVTGISDDFVNAHGLLGPQFEVLTRLDEYLALGIDEAVIFPIVTPGANTKDRQLEVVRALGPG